MATVLSARSHRAWQMALAAIAICVSPAFAQNAPDPDAAATMRFGPLALKSTLALSNIGVDTNVFNQTDGPLRDFTMTFTPTTDLWLRMGRTWIDGTIKVDWVYFNRFASERSANSNYRVGVTRTFNRLAVKSGASRVSTRDRPGFEIDARSQHFEKLFDGEVAIRTHSKTYIGAKAWHRTLTFERDAVFFGASLARELNRTMIGRALVVRHDLTTLTSLSLEAGRDRDRFEFSKGRDADSTRIAGSVKFKPQALISGDASVGYRNYKPVAADVPPYRGPIAAVSLSYPLRGTTRLGVQINRDVVYAFNINQPYFLETGVIGSVQQQIFGPFDALVRIGDRRLAYRDRIGAVVQVSNRTDRHRTLGIGAGYRLGTDKRIGFTLDRVRRASSVQLRQFKGLKFGLSLTYER